MFNAFLQTKMRTQVLGGGNTGEFYAEEGTYPKSEMQIRMHPDVSRMVMRYGRCHHYVDYKPFRANKLIPKKGVTISKKPNNYGMELKKVAT